jgi:hypothetical protein
LGLFEEFYCKGQRWRVQALPAQSTFGSNVELMFILCRRDFQISFLNDSEIPHFLWSQLLGRWKQEDHKFVASPHKVIKTLSQKTI